MDRNKASLSLRMRLSSTSASMIICGTLSATLRRKSPSPAFAMSSASGRRDQLLSWCEARKLHLTDELGGHRDRTAGGEAYHCEGYNDPAAICDFTLQVLARQPPVLRNMIVHGRTPRKTKAALTGPVHPPIGADPRSGRRIGHWLSTTCVRQSSNLLNEMDTSRAPRVFPSIVTTCRTCSVGTRFLYWQGGRT